MSQNQLPPPEYEACLFRLRSSTQKGGTLIAEDVTDHATHERRISDPDGYRLPFCPRCGKGPLHVHDYRERVLRAELRKPVAPIVRLICVSCEAIWQILPLYIPSVADLECRAQRAEAGSPGILPQRAATLAAGAAANRAALARTVVAAGACAGSDPGRLWPGHLGNARHSAAT
jgi:hypothetical protein